MDRYEFLLLRWRAGEISPPEVHPCYPLIITDRDGCDHQIGYWEADFRYFDGQAGATIIEDVKGAYWKKKKQTKGGQIVREWKERAPILDQVYLIKKKIVQAFYNIKITEVWDGQQH